MRVVFIGQSTSFSWPSLQAIAAAHEVVGVVESVPNSAPPRQGRAKGVAKRVLRPVVRRPWLDQYALAHRLPYLRLRRAEMPALHAMLSDLRPDIACVASMSQLLPAKVLSVPLLGMLNLHPSHLPAYRGPNPWLWQILDQVSEVGLTVHRIDAGEDTGDIIAQTAVPVSDIADPRELLSTVAVAGASLFRTALDVLTSNPAAGRPQPPASPTMRARNARQGEKLIDWERWPIDRVARTMRLVSPWHDELPAPGARRRWKVIAVVPGPAHPAPGVLARVDGEWRVGHTDGYIRLRRVWALT